MTKGNGKCHPLASIGMCTCTDTRTNSQIKIQQDNSSVDLTLEHTEDMDLIRGRLPEGSCLRRDSQDIGHPEGVPDQMQFYSAA